MLMLVKDKCGNVIWISFGTEVVKFSNLLLPLLVLLIPQVTIMISVLLNKIRHRLREMLHAVWTHHEILHQMDHLVLEEIDPTPGENVIPQNVTGDPLTGNTENHLT